MSGSFETAPYDPYLEESDDKSAPPDTMAWPAATQPTKALQTTTSQADKRCCPTEKVSSWWDDPMAVTGDDSEPKTCSAAAASSESQEAGTQLGADVSKGQLGANWDLPEDLDDAFAALPIGSNPSNFNTQSMALPNYTKPSDIWGVWGASHAGNSAKDDASSLLNSSTLSCSAGADICQSKSFSLGATNPWGGFSFNITPRIVSTEALPSSQVPTYSQFPTGAGLLGSLTSLGINSSTEACALTATLGSKTSSTGSAVFKAPTGNSSGNGAADAFSLGDGEAIHAFNYKAKPAGGTLKQGLSAILASVMIKRQKLESALHPRNDAPEVDDVLVNSLANEVVEALRDAAASLGALEVDGTRTTVGALGSQELAEAISKGVASLHNDAGQPLAKGRDHGMAVSKAVTRLLKAAGVSNPF